MSIHDSRTTVDDGVQRTETPERTREELPTLAELLELVARYTDALLRDADSATMPMAEPERNTLRAALSRLSHAARRGVEANEDAEKLQRILAIAGRGQDNDGDNKQGAKSMRAALHQIINLIVPDTGPQTAGRAP